VDRLLAQCLKFRPKYAAIADAAAAAELRAKARAAGLKCEVLAGEGALARIAEAPEVDAVMAAIVGSPGCARPWRRRVQASSSCSPTRRQWSWPARC